MTSSNEGCLVASDGSDEGSPWLLGGYLAATAAMKAPWRLLGGVKP